MGRSQVRFGILLVVSAVGFLSYGCSNDRSPAPQALGFSGFWSPVIMGAQYPPPDKSGFSFNSLAKDAYRKFDPATSPSFECVPPGIPWIFYLPYPMQIETTEDTIEISYEYMDVHRTVHLTGEFPNEPHGIFGYSIARFEDEELVIESRNFAPDPVGLIDPVFDRDGQAVPSSAQKSVMSRYRILAEEQLLQATITVDDPVYLTEPMSMTATWRHAPDEQIYEFDCVPEVARRASEYGVETP